MPWLWKAWPTITNPNQLKYALWATMAPPAVQAGFRKGQKSVATLKDYVEIVSEKMLELKQIFEDKLPIEIPAALHTHKCELEEHEDRKPFFLPAEGKNYVELYTPITRHL